MKPTYKCRNLDGLGLRARTVEYFFYFRPAFNHGEILNFPLIRNMIQKCTEIVLNRKLDLPFRQEKIKAWSQESLWYVTKALAI